MHKGIVEKSMVQYIIGTVHIGCIRASSKNQWYSTSLVQYILSNGTEANRLNVLRIKSNFCEANNLNEALAVHYLVLFADLLQFANLKSKQISNVHFRSVGNNIWPLHCPPFWPIFLIAKADCKGFKSFSVTVLFTFSLFIVFLVGKASLATS